MTDIESRFCFVKQLVSILFKQKVFRGGLVWDYFQLWINAHFTGQMSAFAIFTLAVYVG